MYPLFCVVFLSISHYFLLASGHQTTCSPNTDCAVETQYDDERLASAWIGSILTQGTADFIPLGSDENSACTRDGQIYLQHLSNLTFWATKMFEASTHWISGILVGRNFDFGHFDECVSVHSPEHGIRGKFVMAKLQFAPNQHLYNKFNDKKKVYRLPLPEDSAWEAVKPTYDPRISPRNELNWALCVPSSCTDDDIEKSLRIKFDPMLTDQNIFGNISLLREYSYSREENLPSWGISFYIFLTFIAIILALVIFSTYEDVMAPEDVKVNENWYTNFSLKKNLRELFNETYNEFAVISGIKVISKIFIIFGHRMLIHFAHPQFNPNGVQLSTGTYLATILNNGAIVVNTFMVITGFLTFYKITKDIYSNNDLNICRNILNRWLRLTPAYLCAMALQYYFFPYREGGPMSRSVVWSSQHFGDYWWTHLTYLNNYVQTKYQCLIPSWYIAMDMQMYVVCYLIGALVQKMKEKGIHILSLWISISLIIPAVVIAFTHYNGIYLMYFTPLEDFFSVKEFEEMYIPTHIRSGPYLIGMMGGYIYYHAKTKNIVLSKLTMYIWSVIILSFFHAAFLGAWFFYIPGRDYVLWEHIAYSIFHRLVWGVTITWIIIVTCTSNFELFRNMFCCKIFEPLNKLSYSALLLHTLVQIYLCGCIRAPVNYDIATAIWMTCGDVCFTYAFSIIMYCIVEAPFSHLQKKWKVCSTSSKEEDVKK